MSSLPRRRLAGLLLLATAVTGLSGGCAGNHTLVPAAAAAGARPAPIAWFEPERLLDAHVLGRWRHGVGPPVIQSHGPADPTADRLLVVTWNVNVGAGDVAQLLMELEAQAGAGVPIVFLLQEAYRSGDDVPDALAPSVTFASRILTGRADGRRDEIDDLAAGLGLHLYYVPSMRNGGPLASNEDRGNAILSTVPLGELSAIELPFERQRRVAIGATVRGRTHGGEPWELRVVSAHLDNLGGARRLWVAGSEFARTRQVRGLLGAIDDERPTILGADLNTLFGFADRAYLETALAFPDTHVTDRRTTFRGLLRLDHLFFRLNTGWAATFHRAETSYGSDHYPLIGTVTFR
jgi:endonuclease/exonuclease/phosphatase family metal-dependent hydrolase